MDEHERGQVDTSAAEVYERSFVPALFGRFAEPVAAAARLRSTDDVVDVACGTGALTRALRGLTTGRVVGVDLNPAMIAVANRHEGDIEYRVDDASRLPFADDEFDVATCQFGLMFYPAPSEGIVEMARVARRGVVAVWDSIDGSDGYLEMRSLFDDQLGADAAASLDAPFAMGADGVLESAFASARVEDVEFESIPGTGRFGSIDQWVTTEVRGWTLGDSISDERLEELLVEARRRLERFSTGDGCVFGMTAKIGRWGATND